MIQMRWGDETVWKDLPNCPSIGYARWSWAEAKANAQAKGTKLPPDPEFREKPADESAT